MNMVAYIVTCNINLDETVVLTTREITFQIVKQYLIQKYNCNDNETNNIQIEHLNGLSYKWSWDNFDGTLRRVNLIA